MDTFSHLLTERLKCVLIAQMSVLGICSCLSLESAEEKEGNPAVFDSSSSSVAKVTVTLQLALTFKGKKIYHLGHAG